jgi:hypothetical protein
MGLLGLSSRLSVRTPTEQVLQSILDVCISDTEDNVRDVDLLIRPH